MSIALLTLALLGCNDPAASLVGAADASYLEKFAVDPEWLSCEQDSDCVYADLDCCGCTGGGNSLAIHVDYEADFYDANPLDCPEDLGCAGLYLCESAPRCALGRCRGG